VKIDRGVYEPRVFEDAISDIVGVVGGAMPLERFDLRVGASVKAIWRRASRRQLTATEAADFDVHEIAEELEAADPGFSMDLGALWARTDSRFAAGAALRDGWGWIGGDRIDSSLDLGASWTARQRRRGLLRGVLVAADLRDVGEDDPLGKKIHFGAEARLPRVSIRAGAHQGYGTVGLGVALPGVRLDWAYWGRELGEIPGAEDQFLHSVELRFGT